MNKDHFRTAREHEVRLPWQVASVKAKPVAKAMNEAPNGDLGHHAFALDVGHDDAAPG
jgi:hypothetical protein